MPRAGLLVVVACLGLTGRATAQTDATGLDFFERKIRPVLVEHCYSCHAEGAKSLKGGLRVDSRAGLLQGGDSGPALVAGKPEESLLLDALQYDGLEMPPKGKLPEAVVADFTRWVAMGAPDPRAGKPVEAKRTIDIEAGRSHWAYQPPGVTPPPDVKAVDWPINDVDRFLLATLEAKGLAPAPEADRATLIRRLAFDLTGLPPTPDEIDAFLADPRPDAYERLVDRLLASPRFGERFGRHWLDVARFAESLTLRGMVFKYAWRYRDYVIETFNADRPFPQFIREQVAGDLLGGDTLEDQRRNRIAPTFLVLGNTNLEEQDKAQLVMDVVDEQVDTLGKAFLAQTLNCARCHDHKFDPIPTADYYALAGILRNAKTLEHANVSNWIERPLPLEPAEQARWKAHDDAVKALEARIKKANATKTAEGKKEAAQLQTELKTLQAAAGFREAVMTVVEEPKITDAPIHIRGSVHTLGATVPRGFLKIASDRSAENLPSNESGRRELADWLASPDNPLTARVIVNRVWHWLFGAGLVRTVDNFGTTGDAPTHRELLDNLAVQFQNEDAGSIKTLVRRLVVSRTYRQGRGDDAARQADPENRWLARRDRRRLDAECLRDTMLLVSGQLDETMGGPSFPVSLAEDYDFTATADNRRSVYSPAFRNALPALFEVFDFADPSLVVGARNVSTVAPQALFLRNHPFVLEQSRAAAERLLSRDETDAARIVTAFRAILGRPPTDAERRTVETFLSQGDRRESWSLVVQALFGSIDFRYVD